MRPGDRWVDLPFNENTYEALVDVDGEAWPVGDLFPGLVLLDQHAVCCEATNPVDAVVRRLVTANHGRLGGFPDVVGCRRDTVILREAKRKGKDALRSNQHQFADGARAALGDNLDLAVVEWAIGIPLDGEQSGKTPSSP
jgi:hypothetical protein